MMLSFKLMLILFEADGWFLFWTGLDLLISISGSKKAEFNFYRAMENIQVEFGSIDRTLQFSDLSASFSTGNVCFGAFHIRLNSGANLIAGGGDTVLSKDYGIKFNVPSAFYSFQIYSVSF